MIWNRQLCNILMTTMSVVFVVSPDEGSGMSQAMLDHCHKKCNDGVDCELTYLKEKCICKPGYEIENGKCQPKVGSENDNQSKSGISSILFLRTNDTESCEDGSNCKKSEVCLGKKCYDKCRFHHCGKGHCEVNETHPEPTCKCDKGYQLNKTSGICEDMCLNVQCKKVTEICFYGWCADLCFGLDCKDSEICAPDPDDLPNGKCVNKTTSYTEPTTTPKPAKTPTTGITKLETSKPTEKTATPGTQAGTTMEATGSGTYSVTKKTTTPMLKKNNSSTTAPDTKNTTTPDVNTTTNATTTTRLDANSTVSTTVEVPQPSEKNDNDEKNEHDFTYSHGSGIDPNIAEPKFPSKASFNFPIMFMAGIVLVVTGYFLYHNRTKLIALVIEGRSGGGEGRYSKLKNVEDAMPRLRNAKGSV